MRVSFDMDDTLVCRSTRGPCEAESFPAVLCRLPGEPFRLAHSGTAEERLQHLGLDLDLHVGDFEGVLMEGKQHDGFPVVVVSPNDEGWAGRVLPALDGGDDCMKNYDRRLKDARPREGQGSGPRRAFRDHKRS